MSADDLWSFFYQKAKKKERIVDMILKTGVLWQQKNKQILKLNEYGKM